MGRGEQEEIALGVGRREAAVDDEPAGLPLEEWEEILSEPFDWVEELVEFDEAEPPSEEAIPWLYGQCAALAMALYRRDPKRLRFGIFALSDGGRNYNPWHLFVHDERYAYDALGRHELPYELLHDWGQTDLGLTLEEARRFYERQLADEQTVAEAAEFAAAFEPLRDL